MAFIAALPLQQYCSTIVRTSSTSSTGYKNHVHRFTTRATVSTTSPSSTSAADPESNKATVSLVSLGCPKNVTDAEVMLGDLSAHGISILPPPAISIDDDEIMDEAKINTSSNDENADVLIVNTCGFIEDSQRESIETILSVARLKHTTNTKGVIVTGCLAQRYADKLATELPEVDAVIGFEHYDDIPKQVNSIIENYKSKEIHSDGADTVTKKNVKVGKTFVPFRPEHERVRIGYEHSIYIRLAEGCSHNCSFCTIPSFRGKFRSKKWDVVTSEIRHIMKSNAGVKELVLIAEDTNQYGMDFSTSEQDPNSNKRLSDLLEYISNNNLNNQIHWVRLLYCYPSYFTTALIEAIANLDVMCKYIDIPLQHISDSILKRMNRPSRSYTLSLLDKLRQNIPGLVLRTTFIVGFPGETQEDHQELVQFVKEQRFRHAGFFIYRSEEGTPAAEMDDQVPDESKQYRRDELIATQQSIQEDYANAMVGQVVDVLVDKIENGMSIGRTTDNAPYIDSVVHVLQLLPVGEFAKIRILGTSSLDLYGEPVE